MAVAADISGIPHFDCTETTSLGPRWKRWKKAFEFYIIGKGVTQKEQKYALLMHTAGMEVQELFETLPDIAREEADDDYTIALKKLDNYFMQKTNVVYERNVFNNMAQSDGESVDQYIIRLQRQADLCDFGDKRNENLRQQVVHKCSSHELRYKLLEKGNALTFADVQSISRNMEVLNLQAKQMKTGLSHATASPENVNSIGQKQNFDKSHHKNGNKKNALLFSMRSYRTLF